MDSASFPAEIFTIPYDSLPSKDENGPDIINNTISFFESHKEAFLNHLSHYYSVVPIQQIESNHFPNLSDTFVHFIKLLCQLPDPFLPRNLIQLYSESPSLTSAQQVVVSLPLNKRNPFNRFIHLLRDITAHSIYPLELDRILGSAFAHSQTYNFFDFLTKQNTSALCFPFSSFKSFLPEEPPNLYPEIENSDAFDYTKVNVEVPAEMLIAPSQSIAEQLAQLYNNTKLQARSYGLTDEILDSVDSITIKEAEKYRSELKSILLQFERDIATIIKRKPVKSDKKPLSSLYRIHMILRNKCRVQSQRDELIIEKKKLQRELNDYRAEFEEKYGRKISSAADKAPIAAKYQRYKEIKEELARIASKSSH